MPDLRSPLLLFLRRCLAATQAFTRIRIPASLAGWAQLLPGDAADCARHWPGVGLLVGMAGCIVFALASLPLPAGPLSPLVAAVAAVMAMALLTGARHEDSLGRRAGIAALVLVLAARLALLALLGLHSAAGLLAALLGAATVSRLAALLIAWSLPPTPAADGSLQRRADRSALAAAVLWCVAPLLLMLLAGGARFVLLPLVVLAPAFALLRRRFQQQGGVVPDDIGAAQVAFEAAFFLGAAFGVPR